MFSWKPDLDNQNVVILQYQIVNASNDSLRDCYVAQATDFDIGQLDNDHMRFYFARPKLRTGIAWTDPEQEDYGALALIILEAPVTDSVGFVDNANRQLFYSSGAVGSFIDWTDENDPHTPQERYDFMASGKIDGDSGAGDKRVLMGSEKFNMAPGDTAFFAFAFAVIDGIDPSRTQRGKGAMIFSDQIPELEQLTSRLLEQYYITGFNHTTTSVWGQLREHQSEFDPTPKIRPNPTNGDAILSATLNTAGNLGRTVRTETFTTTQTGELEHSLLLTGLPQGSYFVTITCGAKRHTVRLNIVR